MFEKYINTLVEDFNEDCLSYGLIKNSLTDDQEEEIKERIMEHEECFNHKDEFDADNSEIMNVAIYGSGANIAIECNQCGSIIIDNEALGIR